MGSWRTSDRLTAGAGRSSQHDSLYGVGSYCVAVAKLDLGFGWAQAHPKLALAHPIISSSNLIFYFFVYTGNERMDAVH